MNYSLKKYGTLALLLTFLVIQGGGRVLFVFAEEEATSTEELVQTTSTEQNIEMSTASSTDQEEEIEISINSSSSTDIATSTTVQDDEEEESTNTTSTSEVPEDVVPVTSTSTTTSTSPQAPEEPLSVPSPSSTTSITSGDAVAVANILNIVNMNLVNSTGTILFSNFFENQDGTLDFRSSSTAPLGCSLLTCGVSDGVEVHLLNDAFIHNALVLDASTGGNTIDGADNAQISTGNAYTGLNLINVANTNFINSQYLLVSLNAFQDVNGDIVFPSLASFLNSPNHGSTPEIVLSSDGSITNNLDITTGSGNNTSSAQGLIDTGNAHSTSNIFNQLNTSLIGGSSVSILLRVYGDWVGEIFGAPAELTIDRQPGGVVALSNTSSSGVSASSTDLTVHATSSALIQNDLSLSALTGDNAIRNASTSLITTGNAYAGVNLVNIANANVVGRNWILAILNIFGNFHGNIAFGRPDLWIGGQVAAPEVVENGSQLQYKLTVINKGDAEVTNVKLLDEYPTQYLDIGESSLSYTRNADGQLVWDVGTIPPGGATEITYTAQVKDAPQGTDITNRITTEQRETDNNLKDNSETVTVRTVSRATVFVPAAPPPPNINPTINTSLQKTSSSVSARSLTLQRTFPSIVVGEHEEEATQELVLTNPNTTDVSSVILHDYLYDPSGALVHDEMWELGDVLAHEEITLSYTLKFKDKASPGKYTLSTRIDTVSTHDIFMANGVIDLLPLSITLPEIPEVLPPPSTQGFVLGTSTQSLIQASDSSEESEDSHPAVAYADDDAHQRPAHRSFGVYLILFLEMIVIVSVLTLLRRKLAQGQK